MFKTQKTNIQLSLATETNKKRNVWKRSKVESQDEINKS